MTAWCNSNYLGPTVKRATFIEYVFDDASGLFRRSTRSDIITPRAVIYASESTAKLVREAMSCPVVIVTSLSALDTQASLPGTVLFLDEERVAELGEPPAAPVVCVLGATPKDTLPRIITMLGRTTWLAHFVTTAMLSKPSVRTHVERLVKHLAIGDETSARTTQRIGRIALLAEASRREARFERMREFFATQGVGERAIGRLHDVFEELVTNALYDAPLEAGFFDRAKPRTEDVVLPLELACQITYGIESNMAFLRVRDPFGALKFKRLLAVLERCSRAGVNIDDSRGGAGLGMWRVFSLASTISITVIPGKLTEVVVGIETTGRKELLAADFHFAADAGCDAPVLGTLDGDRDLLEQSITLIRVA